MLVALKCSVQTQQVQPSTNHRTEQARHVTEPISSQASQPKGEAASRAVPPACSSCSRKGPRTSALCTIPKEYPISCTADTLHQNYLLQRDWKENASLKSKSSEWHFHFKMPDVGSRDGYPRHNVEKGKISRVISKKRKIPSQKHPNKTNQNPTYSSLDLLQEHLQWKLIHACCA